MWIFAVLAGSWWTSHRIFWSTILLARGFRRASSEWSPTRPPRKAATSSTRMFRTSLGTNFRMAANASLFAGRSLASQAASAAALLAQNPGCLRTAAPNLSAVTRASRAAAGLNFSATATLDRASLRATSSFSKVGLSSSTCRSPALSRAATTASPPSSTSGSFFSVSTNTLALAIRLGLPSPNNAASANAWITALSSSVHASCWLWTTSSSLLMIGSSSSSCGSSGASGSSTLSDF
mmetsp:Transcript_25311/g.65772  ORF Transcript_25311/g.65772 Transcript_25311/m.65772 type:complete len:237 (-) Transcript_25311:892-1602(-)